MNKSIKIGIIVFFISIFSISCVTVLEEYSQAEAYYLMGNYEKAYEFYKKALEKEPLNKRYRIGFIKAKSSLLSSYISSADIFKKNGEYDKSLELLNKALLIDPENPSIVSKIEELKRLKEGVKNFEKVKVEKPNLKREKITINFKNAPLRQIFTAVAQSGGYSVVFDVDFKDKEYSVNLRNVYWEDALSMIAFATKNIYRKTDKGVIIIAPDNYSTKKRYKEEVVKTVYLKNGNAKDIASVAGSFAMGKVKLKPLEDLNAIVLYGGKEDVINMEKFIKSVDKPKDQVIIEISIMEVNRRRLKDLGIDYFSTADGVGLQINEQTDEEGTVIPTTLSTIKDISSSDISVVVPPAMVKMLERDGDTKVLANPRIVGVHRQKIVFKIGEKFPFPNSQWSPISPGGVPTNPVTSYDYKDVGLNFELTPEIHGDNEVTLKTKIQISALGSTGYANIPSIKNREIELYLRMRDGETHILAGLLQEEEKKSLSGILGLTKIPVIGSIFGSNSSEYTQTDIVFTITPHIIRKNVIKKEDEKPISFSKLHSGGAEESYEEIAKAPRVRIGGRIPSKKAEDKKKEETGENRVNFPDSIYGKKGETSGIEFEGEFSSLVKSLSIRISFDPSYLKVESIDSSHKMFKYIDNSGGNVTIGLNFDNGLSGNTGLFSIVFKFIKEGKTKVSVSSVSGRDRSMRSVSIKYPSTIMVTIR